MARGGEVVLVMEREAEAAQFEQAWRSLKLTNTIRSIREASEALAFLSNDTSPPAVAVFISLSLSGAAQLLAWLDGPKPGQPVPIALTGFGDMRPVIQAHHLGLNYFLEWPVKVEDLRRALASISELKVTDTAEGRMIELAQP